MSVSNRELVVLDGKDDVARRGAELFIEAAHDAVLERGIFTVALSGGSTPKGMYQLLASDPYRDRVEWERANFFWSDERCVPPDSPDSDYHMAEEAMLHPLGILPSNIHRIKGEIDPQVAAHEYETEVREWVPGSPPRFDLILLGMGDDGHTASLFPHTEALDETDRLVVANYVPQQEIHDRITFTTTLINAAKLVVFLVTGEAKAEPLRAVLEGPRDTDQYPSQLVDPLNGRLIWLVDKAAASLLSSQQSAR